MKKQGANKKTKIFAAMSGGVDSSVAALLLQKQGYALVGCYIKGWYPPGVVCNWKEDRRDAMRVCAKLGVPFITVDAEKEYKKEVVDYMVREYKAGRTPNPDIMCNKSIKFGVFLNKALDMGADYIATGHYVKKLSASGGKTCELVTAKDLNKDQSYFLWTLTQEQLKYCLFPLGEILKTEVRKIAKENDLATAEKEESQGVCFIGEFNMEDFLKKYIKPKKGKITTSRGEIVGEHNGLAFYTVGQRHGFGYAGGNGGPYYVVEKDFKKNELIVAEKLDEREFAKTEVDIMGVNWIDVIVPKTNRNYLARIRYRQPLEKCKISKVSKKSAKIVFDNPQRAVTPGQSLVVYDGKKMLGGGIIQF